MEKRTRNALWEIILPFPAGLLISLESLSYRNFAGAREDFTIPSVVLHGEEKK
jgi:hypothetical protein